MKFAVDLHMHSALSPCGDNDMTPNNIVHMAILKGLDMIAVTDHNTCGNLRAVSDAGRAAGIMVIPGLEVQTKEEVHILCYFKKLESALTFGEMVYAHLPDIPNRENLFGEQLLLDAEDHILGKERRMLLSSTDLSIDQVFAYAKKYEGMAVPAHVDRQSYSIVGSLGFIPSHLGIKTVEVAGKNISDYSEFQCIHSSDAHYLWDISERDFFIEIEEMTMTNLFQWIDN